MLKKNEIIELTIDNISNDGSGVGHYDGMAVFVPYTAKGDKCSVKIVNVKKTYCFGILDKVLDPSPDRIVPDCSLYGKCGGCSLRHISYEAELALKTDIVKEALKRIGNIDTEVEPCLGSPEIDRYRNKVQFPVTINMEPGFYAKRSHRALNAADVCLLQPQILNDIAKYSCQLLKFSGVTPYDEELNKGLLRHVYLRSSSNGDILLCFVINGNKLPNEDMIVDNLRNKYPCIKSIVLNLNKSKGNVILGKENRILFGDGTIKDSLGGVELKISAMSFFQINRNSAENLYSVVKNYCGDNDGKVVLDLFCGAGSIGLSVAGKCSKLVGVETIEDAVRDARINAANNNVENAVFYCTTSEEASRRLAEEGLKPDVVITDPPRSGCEPGTIDAIVEMNPKRIVMVSCNASTLARDLKLLVGSGYKVNKAQPVDMFPRTPHVETVVLLSR